MPLNYAFHPAARAEHLEQVAFYEERLAGLGRRYLDAFDTAMERICSQPETYSALGAIGIRKLNISGFPYSVLYRVRANAVEVLAVAHHKRRPAYWVDRV